ncbi:hypothetical protein IJN73_03330 [Candidatus Saccharibacteria bacterium]|nr:hypothetical protein [Candidatus Saccharibacteria bacterium]
MNSTLTWDNLTPKEAAFAGGMLGTLMISIMVFYIFVVIALWKIFTKAGIKGWKSLIPIYNLYCAYKMVGISPLWILWQVLSSLACSIALCVALGDRLDAYLNSTSTELPEDVVTNGWVIITTLIACVISIYIGIRFAIRLAKAFGKGGGFAVGLIFLQPIFLLILGFGSAKYDKKILKA